MRIKLTLPGLILLIIGCNTTQRDDKVTNDADEKIEIDSASSVVYDPSGAIWSYNFNEEKEEFEIKKMRPVDKDTLTGGALARIINKSWPRVQIEFIGTSNDTAYVSIPASQVLTQQMGSAGAESFMISTTYSFTELKGINYVSFDFEEGDHARPGVYNRSSWDENISR
jgi:hypothetical protein